LYVPTCDLAYWKWKQSVYIYGPS